MCHQIHSFKVKYSSQQIIPRSLSFFLLAIIVNYLTLSLSLSHYQLIFAFFLIIQIKIAAILLRVLMQLSFNQFLKNISLTSFTRYFLLKRVCVHSIHPLFIFMGYKVLKTLKLLMILKINCWKIKNFNYQYLRYVQKQL